MKEGEVIDLSQYSVESVVRRYLIKGKLSNIHGEHARRTQKLSIRVIEEADLTTQTEDSSKQEEKAEDTKKLEKRAKQREKFEEVHTFPTDEKGNLLVPLGGPRGYIMGALKAAINDLYKDKMKDKNWEGYGIKTFIEHGVFIEPSMVSVGNKLSNKRDEPLHYMVQTKGAGAGMMTTYYDVVEHADFELTIEMTNPKIPEPMFLQMLAHVQRLGIGPKGRGSIVFTEVKRA